METIEEGLVTPTEEVFTINNSKEFKILSKNINLLISLKLEVLKKELQQEIKELFFASRNSQLTEIKKKKKEQNKIFVCKIKRRFKEDILYNYSQETITLNYLNSCLKNNCFDENKKLIRNKKIYSYLYLTPLEQELQKYDNIRISIEDKLLLLNKIIKPETKINFEGIEIDLLSENLIDFLIDHKLITEIASTEMISVNRSFLQFLKKKYKKKININYTDFTEDLFLQFIIFLLENQTNIYIKLNPSYNELYKSFEIDFVVHENFTYTKENKFRQKLNKTIFKNKNTYAEKINDLKMSLGNIEINQDNFNLEHLISIFKK